jgi:hypothetical protein
MYAPSPDAMLTRLAASPFSRSFIAALQVKKVLRRLPFIVTSNSSAGVSDKECLATMKPAALTKPSSAPQRPPSMSKACVTEVSSDPSISIVSVPGGGVWRARAAARSITASS